MRQRRSPIATFAAWLVTGPLGHFWSGLVDVLALAGAWARARIRARPRSRR
jgi:hypothetical protein